MGAPRGRSPARCSCAAAFRDELRAANAMFLDGEISELYVAPGALPSPGGAFASIIALTVPLIDRGR